MQNFIKIKLLFNLKIGLNFFKRDVVENKFYNENL